MDRRFAGTSRVLLDQRVGLTIRSPPSRVGRVPADQPPEWDWEAYATAVGRRLALLRQRTGMSQIDLAHRAEIAPNSVKLIERGRSSGPHPANPGMHTIYRLAEGLGVSPADLLPSAGDPPGAAPREAGADYDWSGLTVETRTHRRG